MLKILKIIREILINKLSTNLSLSLLILFLEHIDLISLLLYNLSPTRIILSLPVSYPSHLINRWTNLWLWDESSRITSISIVIYTNITKTLIRILNILWLHLNSLKFLKYLQHSDEGLCRRRYNSITHQGVDVRYLALIFYFTWGQNGNY